MVAMHAPRQELPTQVSEAVEAVATCLPPPPPSKDYAEENFSDMDESNSAIESPGTTRPLSLDADAAIAELDMVDDEDESALLALAQRLKQALPSMLGKNT